MTVTEIKSVQELETKLSKAPRAVVHFGATWSPLCKKLSPSFEHLSTSKGNVAFYKVNVDDVSHAVSHFKIRDIPTFRLFKGSYKVGDVVGDKADIDSLSNLIEELLV